MGNGIEDTNPTPPWIELPRDVTENILSRLRPVEILENAQYVCTTWRSVCNEPSIWRVIDMKISLIEDHDIFFIHNIACRRAVDLSQGELLNINIEFFGTNDLLHYISKRSSRLKRLRLKYCDYISGEALRASFKNFPELEELQLFFMSRITAEHIEGISISCPNLKSFTFIKRSSRFAPLEIDDSYALTIAKIMPNLQHLCLIGNKLSNEGLEAILNGCPKLESLDLRKCYNVDLQGDFGKICSERIKYLKCHSNSTNDNEWDDMIIEEDMII
ncbi:hypothetical protein CASFOL_014508 [Castilleja foliolosa]|uniref:F-box domain-containing protein n=1 Tax=Castilleja foliolosa TaxID=1961234 RepID=A0ABD3DN25_9LAMI